MGLCTGVANRSSAVDPGEALGQSYICQGLTIGSIQSANCRCCNVSLRNLNGHGNFYGVVVFALVVNCAMGLCTGVANRSSAVDPGEALGQSYICQGLTISCSQASGELIAGICLGNFHSIGGGPAPVIIGNGDHSFARVQSQNGVCPIVSNRNFRTIYGDGHILTNGHALHSGKHLTQGQRIAIGDRNIFYSLKLILCEDVFLLPIGHIACKRIAHCPDCFHLGRGIGSAVIAQSGIHSFHRLAQGGCMLSTVHNNSLTVHTEGNGGLSVNGGSGAQLAQGLVAGVQNVLHTQRQLILFNGAVLCKGLGAVVVDPQTVAIAFHHSLDHSICFENSLIAQRGSVGNQADPVNARIEPVGAVNTVLLNHQVVLRIMLDYLLHGTVDRAAERAALLRIVFIIGRVHQPQGHALRHGGVGHMMTVQIQQCILLDRKAIRIFRKLHIARSIFFGKGHYRKAGDQGQNQDRGNNANSPFCAILHKYSS